MRRHDWSRTPNGPPDGWPQSVRAIIRTMLTSRFRRLHMEGAIVNDVAEWLSAKAVEAVGLEVLLEQRRPAALVLPRALRGGGSRSRHAPPRALARSDRHPTA
jgi:hypothetical protein